MTPERFRRLQRVLDRRQPDLTLVMERVHKPHNLAAILRNCDAVGMMEVHVVPPEGGLELSRASAAGTQKWVAVRRHADAPEALGHLRELGLRIVAAHPSGRATDYRAVDFTAPTALLMGAELHGLSQEALELADQRAVVPMEGMVRSLNVSVAAALLLYEARRQREEAGMYASSRLPADARARLLFEWAHPRLARDYRRRGEPYPPLDEDGGVLAPGEGPGARSGLQG